MLVVDITNANEEEKEKLRGAIRYFNGDKNNINIFIKIKQDLKSCGKIYLTEDILKIFQKIVGVQNIELRGD